ncbi:MAG: serine/threonine protein phosphatase, partial [Herpetosiphonaceae bacterium]|nr:serine/threonine protein phosphatase [Herpetosiphonaceae bacterium]
MAALGWAVVLFLGGLVAVLWHGLPEAPWPVLPIAGALLVLLDGFAVRDRSSHPLSLSGVVLLAVAMYHPPVTPILLAFVSGLLIKPPRSWQSWREVVARRAVESGGRTLALALVLPLLANYPLLPKLLWLMLGYVLVLQAARIIFGLLWDGPPRLRSLLRVIMPDVLLIEVVPLPLAAVGAEMARVFEWPLVALAAGGLVGSAAMVRRGARSLGQQRRAVAELGQINAISRAIIRAELDVDALCNLIYSEAAKVVDTRNFRLGLF